MKALVNIFAVALAIGLPGTTAYAQESKPEAKPTDPPVRTLGRTQTAADQKSQGSAGPGTQVVMPIGPTPTGTLGTPPASGQAPIGSAPQAGKMPLGEPPKAIQPK